MVILFLVFICMNYIPNQNQKVVEETLAGFNSDDGKKIWMQLRCFKITITLFQILQKFHAVEKRELKRGFM